MTTNVLDIVFDIPDDVIVDNLYNIVRCQSRITDNKLRDAMQSALKVTSQQRRI